MKTEALIDIVDGILGDDNLCNGCAHGERYGYEGIYGSCKKCRREAANEIIEILRKSGG